MKTLQAIRDYYRAFLSFRHARRIERLDAEHMETRSTWKPVAPFVWSVPCAISVRVMKCVACRVLRLVLVYCVIPFVRLFR